MKKSVIAVIPITICAIVLIACRIVTPFTGAPLSTPTGVPLPPVQTALPPTLAPEPSGTPTPDPPKPFSILQGAPLFSPAFLHADLGCAWMGVAGQAFGADGEPLANLVVSVTGSIGSSPLDLTGTTGAAAGYGPGGYEIQLSDQTQAGVFLIQLHDLDGKALSEPFEFAMSGGCEQNLAVINFVQEGGEYQQVLPLIIN